jgi:hypothetical protein
LADEFKSIRESLFKLVAGRVTQTTEVEVEDDDEGAAGGDTGGARGGILDASAARALVSALFTKAGKGKDEIVQIIAREIGVAVAAMLKEPLAQLAQHQKLRISFEFVPKKGHPEGLSADADAHEEREPKRSRRRRVFRSGGGAAKPKRPVRKRKTESTGD